MITATSGAMSHADPNAPAQPRRLAHRWVSAVIAGNTVWILLVLAAIMGAFCAASPMPLPR